MMGPTLDPRNSTIILKQKKEEKHKQPTVFGGVVDVVEDGSEAVRVDDLGIGVFRIQLFKHNLEAIVEIAYHVVHVLAAFPVHALLPHKL